MYRTENYQLRLDRLTHLAHRTVPRLTPINLFLFIRTGEMSAPTPARRRRVLVAESSAEDEDTDGEEDNLLSPAESIGALRRAAHAEGILATGMPTNS